MQFSKDVKKTVEAYLPLIYSKVTDLKTICKYLKYLQGLAADVNMPFVNVTLDAGVVIIAYRVIWNYPEQFANVLLHFKDFHFMKENFLFWANCLFWASTQTFSDLFRLLFIVFKVPISSKD